MKGEIAQFVALVCYGNARLRGLPTPSFTLEHSTCTFCRSIEFVAFDLPEAQSMQPARRWASSPEEWLTRIVEKGIVSLHLRRKSDARPGLPDRMGAGFVGGGGIWRIEAHRPNGSTDIWLSRWQVVDSEAPDRRIWGVDYGLVAKEAGLGGPVPELAPFRDAFRSALGDARSFAIAQNLDAFANCFAEAERLLDDPSTEGGYHRDLAPPGALSAEAASMLRAAQPAWVFGGMGSWNDIVFDDEAGADYERVSERLYQTLTGAIQVAASSSAAK